MGMVSILSILAERKEAGIKKRCLNGAGVMLKERVP
jgi:hypothetical protein